MTHPGPQHIFRALSDYSFALVIITGLTGSFFVTPPAFLCPLFLLFVAGLDPIKDIAVWDGKIQEYDQERTQSHP